MDEIRRMSQRVPTAAAQIPYWDAQNGQGARAPIGAIAETVGTLLGTPGAIPGFSLVMETDGPPDNALGADGWLAIDKANGAIYTKVNGLWVLKAVGVPIPDLAISGAPIISATVGQPYSGFLMTASGGTPPYTYSDPAGSLPDGLSLHPSIGLVSGVPTRAGQTGLVALVATDANNRSVIFPPFRVAIVAPDTPLGIAGAPVTEAIVGVPFSGFVISAYGGQSPYTYSVHSGALPDGIALGELTGFVSGTPYTAGVSSGIVIRVTDSEGAFADLAAFSITVAAAPVALEISGTPNPNATVGAAYSFTPTAVGGVAPRSFSLIAGTLPAGLDFNPMTGTISGTLAAAGASAGLVIRVTDQLGATDDLGPFTITASTAPPLNTGVLVLNGFPLTINGNQLVLV